MGIGNRIKIAREKKRLTQKQLAMMIGVSSSAIANYETEVSHPKEQILYKLIDALEVDANYLFGESSRQIISDEELKFALWGGEAKEITDAQYQEVLRFAQFVKERDVKHDK